MQIYKYHKKVNLHNVFGSWAVEFINSEPGNIKVRLYSILLTIKPTTVFGYPQHIHTTVSLTNLDFVKIFIVH